VPHARTANSLAFQTLLAYVDELRGDGAACAQQLYCLEFYAWLCDSSPVGRAGSVHQENIPGNGSMDTIPWLHTSSKASSIHSHRQNTGAAQEDSTENIIASGTQFAAGISPSHGKQTRKLKRISLQLPPPPPHCSERLPRAVQQAFGRLFKSLHLHSPLPAETDAPQCMQVASPAFGLTAL
jgi:hypothetical protein